MKDIAKRKRVTIFDVHKAYKNILFRHSEGRDILEEDVLVVKKAFPFMKANAESVKGLVKWRVDYDDDLSALMAKTVHFDVIASPYNNDDDSTGWAHSAGVAFTYEEYFNSLKADGRSNIRVLKDQFDEMVKREMIFDYKRHNTIAFHITCFLDPKFVEALESLDDYPLLDDSDYFEEEDKLKNESWEKYYKWQIGKILDNREFTDYENDDFDDFRRDMENESKWDWTADQYDDDYYIVGVSEEKLADLFIKWKKDKGVEIKSNPRQKIIYFAEYDYVYSVPESNVIKLMERAISGQPIDLSQYGKRIKAKLYSSDEDGDLIKQNGKEIPVIQILHMSRDDWDDVIYGLTVKSNPTTSKRTDEKLWEKSKKEAVAKLGGHSARAMQLAVALYKKKGGQYIGKKNVNNSLATWTKADWKYTDKNCERYLPAAAWKKLTEAEKKETCKLKKGHKGEWIKNTPKAARAAKLATKKAALKPNPTSEQPYMNCRMYVQIQTGVGDIESLPVLKKLKKGAIVWWGHIDKKKKTLQYRHVAIYEGDGLVSQVEEWGAPIKVVPLADVVKEYGGGPDIIFDVPVEAASETHFILDQNERKIIK